jgi:hypothetical protein
MKQKDKLFELIKVLNSSEKQWVVKCLKAFKQNNNLLLFKCLDKQESYNKKQLFPALKNAPFLKYLPVQKNNLYNSILKFLKSYINEAEEDCTEHLDSFFEFTFLQNRGLGNHSLGQLRKIQEHATEQQEHYQMLQMISMESDIISSGLQKPTSIEDLDTINNSYIEGLDLLKDIWNYKFWASKISVLRHNPEILSIKEHKQVLASIEDFLNTHKAPPNQIARYYYYQVNLLYYLYIEDFVTAFFYTEIQIEYIENVNLKTYKAQKEKAIVFVNSVAIAFLAKVEDSKIKVLIEKTHRLLKKDIFVPFHTPLYNQLYYNQLNHYNFKNYTADSSKLVQEVLHKHKVSSLEISPNLSLSIASYYFIQRDLDQAIAWNNKIMSAPKKNILYFVHYNALVLKLLIHIELNNVFYIQSILQSLKRFITKKELSNDFNNNLYRFFKKFESEMLSAFPNTTTLCRQFYKHLVTQKLDARKNLRFVDLTGWIKTR